MITSKLASNTIVAIFTLLPFMTEAETLVIYNWAEYLSKETIAEFETQTGHQIREVYFDNEGDRDRVILSSQRAEYDLVMFDEHSLSTFSDNDLLEDLSNLSVKGKNNQGAEFRKACGARGIPFGWGTIGIAYRDSAINQEINSWKQLFTPPIEAKQGIIMPLDEVDTTSALLLALGEDSSSDNFELLEASLELLKSQMPYLINYGYGPTYAELRGDQTDMVMTMAYSSDIGVLIRFTGQNDWKYVVPKEGASRWLDCWVIPTGKKISQAVIDFLSHMNIPEVAAKNAERMSFSTTNTKAKVHFSTEYLNNEILNPTPEVLNRSTAHPVISSEGLRLRNWLVFSAKSNFDAIVKQR